MPTKTIAQLEAELEAAQAEAAALRAAAPKLEIKVSARGGVQINGLGGRFPTTLYPEAMLKLCGLAPQIEAFIAANRTRLAWRQQ